ncbi:MAG: flagellar export chaperone FliS [Polynucleobacter sp.]|nr:flagellar export chaperone FliS [Polynucleobacter sp.]
MNTRAAKMYAENNTHTSVVSADSGQLIVLVYERIFDHLKLAKLALENGQYAIEPFTKAHDLMQQGLLACLDYQNGGDVAQSLGAVYEWALREILNARLTKSPAKVQEVLDVLAPLYEAWLALAPKESIPSLRIIQGAGETESRAVNY